MSVWNTLSAGLQKVQQSLDQVLEGDQTDGEQVQRGDEAVSATPTSEPGQTTVFKQPASPPKTAQAPPPNTSEMESLRQALVESEQQLQLINMEYKRLLREKESEIQSLKKELSTEPVPSGGGDQDSSTLEMAQKELAAHKEMVAELRTHLIEKEQELQELNSKAETKFNKLKSQAKTKITSLNKEVERLRTEKGEESGVNISTLSLDDSIASSVGGASLSAHPQLESLRSEVKSKDVLLSDLREELELLRGEKNQISDQLTSLWDRLNVSEVCLKNEKEVGVELQLQVTRLEEEMGRANQELATSVSLRDTALEEVKNEKEAKQALQSQVTDLIGRLETQSEGGMKQVLSFASSGVQGSLLDLEDEISRLEATLHDRDNQLSSFKTILEEKQQLLQQEKLTSSNLTTQLEEKMAEFDKNNRENAAEMEQLQQQLAASGGEIARYTSSVESLQTASDDLAAQNESYSVNLLDLNKRVEELTNLLTETQESRDQLKRDMTEMEATHLNTISECKEQLGQKEVEIEGLQKTVTEVQTTYRSLQDGLTSDIRSSADKLADSHRKMEELEQRVVELQKELVAKEQIASDLEHSNRTLEESLAVSKEGLQQSLDTSQREYGELESSLMEQLAEKDDKIREIGEKLNQKENDIAISNEKMDATLKELSKVEEKVEELLTEKKSLLEKSSELDDKCSRASGALEFAQQELLTRENTIKSLSHALDEKKASISSLESDIARVKSENADKLTEVVQRSEEAFQTRSDLENKVNQLQRSLESKERELVSVQEALKKLQTDSENLQQELVVSQSQLLVLEREKEENQIEHETLRGKVENLSQLESSFSQEQTRYNTEVTDLKSQLSQKTTQVTEMQQKLRNAKQQLQKAAKAKQEFTEYKGKLESELDKHKKENTQMKEQFDSAVKMMDTKSANQAAALTQAAQELSDKDTLLASLNAQLSSERQNIVELKEKITKISADYKISTERCRLLEQEKLRLTQKMAELSSEHSHLSQSLSDVQCLRDSLQLEHETLLRGSQEREGKVVELTQQCGQLAREKQGYEDKVRELSRQLVASEQRQLSLGGELEALQRWREEGQHWETEKQTLLGDSERLEQEKSALEANESLLRGQVEQLQGQMEQLQQELSGSLLQLESAKKGSETALVEELKKRLTSQAETHLTETTQLQQSLQQERERRENAEKISEELKGEVAITLEDQGTSEESSQPQTFMDYVEVAKIWFQRFFKNPNVVLMRLYRATPQTKLFFLAYFVLLHLLLLYLFVV
ncbi:myosin-9-like isoform X2 [Halichondria panicea]|uniref:myosin-9-like isoform X2 n=1 Tax=Halichondria panicea TaxID=6063 RepID=UPI00312B4FD9